jgi:esterase/lipase
MIRLLVILATLSVIRSGMSLKQYSHLVVLAHGLAGTSEDLAYLSRELQKENNMFVLASRVNENKTKDGIIAGGNRLAEDVLRVRDNHPELKYISFVGNSLGGMASFLLLLQIFSSRKCSLDSNVFDIEHHHSLSHT